jgi:hypothetical protein
VFSSKEEATTSTGNTSLYFFTSPLCSHRLAETVDIGLSNDFRHSGKRLTKNYEARVDVMLVPAGWSY